MPTASGRALIEKSPTFGIRSKGILLAIIDLNDTVKIDNHRQMNALKAKLLQKKHLWHLGAALLFLVIAISYTYPALKGYSVRQGDIVGWAGMSQEIMDYYAEGQIGWTNSMFSGMPANQISMYYEGVQGCTFLRRVYSLWFSRPVSTLLIHFFSFYIMALSFRVKPWIAIAGAIAYGLSSYTLICIEAGHVTKAFAMGYMPLLVAGFNFAYRRKNWWMGAGLSALFMMFELAVNHVQITYYASFLLLALGTVECIQLVRDKKRNVKQFLLSTAGILVGYGLALMVNIGNVVGTAEYAQHTIRGEKHLTAAPNGEKVDRSIASGGLDKDYITAWSYGKAETFTLLVPNFKGGKTGRLGTDPSNASLLKSVKSAYRNDVQNQNQYWGEQPFTSGPVYLGVIVCFLAVLGLIYSREKYRWGLLAATVLTVMLSWGRHFMLLTDFFIDFIPLYSKFRAVSMILVIAQLCLPLLGVLFLHRLVTDRSYIRENSRPLLITAAAFGGLLLLFMAFPTAFNTFLTDAETAQLTSMASNPQADPRQVSYVENVLDGVETVRIGIFRRDVTRSLVFFLAAFGCVFAFVRGWLNAYAFSGVLTVLVLADMGLIAKRYLGTERKGRGYEQWTESWKQRYPFEAGSADEEIYRRETAANPAIKTAVDSAVQVLRSSFTKQTKANERKRREDWKRFRALNRITNYRVLDKSGSFTSSRAAYFHKSIGGYHAAKLGRYQDLIEFHISRLNPSVLDMLNMKYEIVTQTGKDGTTNNAFIGENRTAMGNAWLTKKVKKVADADEEIAALTAAKGATVRAANGKTVLVNGRAITTAVKVSERDRIAAVARTVNESGMKVADTTAVSIPFQALGDLAIALIADSSGKLTWAYNDLLNPTADRVVIASNADRAGWNPRSETVVSEEVAPLISQAAYSGEGTIAMTAYHPDKLTYRFKSDERQLAVFSEIYYPLGWKAYVDGKETPIARVNYALRAIEIPEGEHTVQFIYRLKSYERSGKIAWAGFGLMALLIGVGLYRGSKHKGDEK